MKNLNRISKFWYRPWAGLLLIRVAAGLMFINHGWMKFSNMTATVAFMGSLGIPAWLAYLVPAVELLGGIMLVAGILTRAAAVGTGLVALFAFILVTLPKRGLSGSELELLLTAVSFGIVLSGSGRARLLHVFEHD